MSYFSFLNLQIPLFEDIDADDLCTGDFDITSSFQEESFFNTKKVHRFYFVLLNKNKRVVPISPKVYKERIKRCFHFVRRSFYYNMSTGESMNILCYRFFYWGPQLLDFLKEIDRDLMKETSYIGIINFFEERTLQGFQLESGRALRCVVFGEKEKSFLL